jgi:hypothetical protein
MSKAFYIAALKAHEFCPSLCTNVNKACIYLSDLASREKSVRVGRGVLLRLACAQHPAAADSGCAAEVMRRVLAELSDGEGVLSSRRCR